MNLEYFVAIILRKNDKIKKQMISFRFYNNVNY